MTTPAGVDQPPTAIVWLGNRAPIDFLTDNERLREMTPDEIQEQGIPRIRQPIPVPKACTRAVIEPGLRLMDAAKTITESDRVWARTSDDPAPAWVASTWPALAALLGDHYECEVRDPEPEHGPYVVVDPDSGVESKVPTNFPETAAPVVADDESAEG